MPYAIRPARLLSDRDEISLPREGFFNRPSGLYGAHTRALGSAYVQWVVTGPVKIHRGRSRGEMTRTPEAMAPDLGQVAWPERF
jgi:hypothetical protein